MRPRRIGLEATSLCQLQCPSCPTAIGATRAVLGAGYLKLEDFKRLVDANPWVSEIELSNYGEMFLNPDLLAILEYAHARGVYLTANNGVNLNHAREPVLEGLVRYRLRSLTCSIDGTNDETYGLYRVRGSFDKVLANVRRINHYKARYHSRYPRLAWQFVVFGHNEHQIAHARRLARDLNMRFYLKLQWNDEHSPVRDMERVKREIGLNAASREEYERRHGVNYMREMCHQLWTKPQINWDGKVLGCCLNFWGDFGGNAFRDGLAASLSHEKMSYAKDMLFGRKAAREDIPCTTCDVYHSMAARGHWLTRAEIRAHSLVGRLVYHYRDVRMLARWLFRRVRGRLGSRERE